MRVAVLMTSSFIPPVKCSVVYARHEPIDPGDALRRGQRVGEGAKHRYRILVARLAELDDHDLRFRAYVQVLPVVAVGEKIAYVTWRPPPALLLEVAETGGYRGQYRHCLLYTSRCV